MSGLIIIRDTVMIAILGWLKRRSGLPYTIKEKIATYCSTINSSRSVYGRQGLVRNQSPNFAIGRQFGIDEVIVYTVPGFAGSSRCLDLSKGVEWL